MARETRSRDVDGITFTVSQLPAMRSVRLMHKLTKAAGPSLLKALGAGAVGLQDVGSMGDALQLALDRFSADDLEALIRELFADATLTLDGNTVPVLPVFDLALAGKPGTVIKALQFALEVNYSDFLGGLLARVRGLQAPGPSPSKVQ